YRGTQVDSHGHATHDDSHGHGSHGEPHESPMVMLAPLMILALLSTVGGFVGLGNHFEHFLVPVFGSGEVAEAAGQVAHKGMEFVLMGVSVVVALLGMALAAWLYLFRPELPQKISNALGSLYETVVHKYYVDEIYAAVFVKPLVDGSTKILWQGVDRKVIDAT